MLKKRAKQNSAPESAPESGAVSKDPDLTNEFTKMTLLLDLLILLNRDDSVSKFQAFRNSVDDHPLLALAAILVMEHEIITARYSLQPEIVLARQSATDPNAESANSSLDTLQATRPSLRTLRLAVWLNHNSSNNDGNSSVNQSRMIDTKKAIGFWDKVQKNPWYCAPLT